MIGQILNQDHNNNRSIALIFSTRRTMKKARDYLAKHRGERKNSGRVEIMDCGAD